MIASNIALKVLALAVNRGLSTTMNYNYALFKKKKTQGFKKSTPFASSKASKIVESSQSQQKGAFGRSHKNNNLQALPQTPQSRLRQKISSTSALSSLLQYRQQVFTKNPTLIPFYLSHLTPLLTPSSFNANRPALSFIYQALNNFSQQLNLTPLQCLTMLHYYDRNRAVDVQYSYPLNFGLQRKLSIVCSSLIHKRQLQINQSIYVLQALIKMGSSSVILFMNFVKYIKNAINSPKMHQTIGVVELITILNVSRIKRNQITLQTILYDNVLHHLLTKMPQYYPLMDISTKVEILNLFLGFDMKKFYRTSRQNKQLWSIKILLDITQTVKKGQWVQQFLSLDTEKTEEDQINLCHVLSIADAITFNRSNSLEYEVYSSYFEQFLTQVRQILVNQLQNNSSPFSPFQKFLQSQSHQQILFRLLFNRMFVQTWILDSRASPVVNKLISKMSKMKERAYYPLIDVLNETKYEPENALSQELFKVANQIYYQCKKNNLTLWGLAAQLIDHLEPNQGLQIIQEMSSISLQDDRSKETVLSYTLLVDHFSKKHGIADLQAPKGFIQLFHQKLQNPKQFISSLHTAVMNFRNTGILGNTLQTMLKTSQPLTQYFQKLKTKRILDNELFQVFDLIFLTLCNNPKELLIPQLQVVLHNFLKDEVIKHQILSSYYPQAYPHPQKYHKNANCLSNPQTFRQNFEVILTYYSSTKFSYYLWDNFIKNYVRLPLETRAECYDLCEKVFRQAYQRDNLRKIILLHFFSNIVVSGDIVGPKERIRACLQQSITELLAAQQIIQFHYHCYLQIVLNCIAADFMTLQLFHAIMKHALQRSPQLKHTTTLMLFYGAFMTYKGSVLPQYEQMVKQQQKYLKYLVDTNRYKVCSIQDIDQVSQSENKGEHILSGKMVALYLMFKHKSVLGIKQMVYQYLQTNRDLTQWKIIACCFDSYSQSKDRQDILFKRKIAKLIRQRLQGSQMSSQTRRRYLCYLPNDNKLISSQSVQDESQ